MKSVLLIIFVQNFIAQTKNSQPIEFEERVIQGQTNASNHVMMLERKKPVLNDFIDFNIHLKNDIIRILFPAWEG